MRFGRSVAYFGIVILAHFCGGCGLLWVPSLEVVPAPVQKVSVRDANTKQIISSANVECQIIGIDTKTYLFQRSEYLFTSWPGPKVLRNVKITPKSGEFIVHDRLLLAWWQDLWPLFSWATPGDWHYHGYRGRMIITAPGYAKTEMKFPSNADVSDFKGGVCDLRTGLLTCYLT